MPSVLRMCDNNDRVESCFVPEFESWVCILVFTKSRGNPNRVPTIPAEKPPIASSPRWNVILAGTLVCCVRWLCPGGYAHVAIGLWDGSLYCGFWAQSGEVSSVAMIYLSGGGRFDRGQVPRANG
mmetsp:Transcript_22130/g.46690  ORF Transcript_22130/g.46690 Transcript_22130/m.46690 type:complete len:125 (-) Transcript_22130:50-424(-)